MWDAETGDRIVETNNTHTDIITALAFSPDNKVLVSASGGSTNLTEKIPIILWSLDGSTGFSLGTQIGLPLYGHQSEIEKIIFSPNSRYLSSGDKSGLVLLWDLHNNNFHTDGTVVSDIKTSPDGTVIVAIGNSPHGDAVSITAIVNSKLIGEIKGDYCYGYEEAENCGGTWINEKKISDGFTSNISTSILSRTKL